MSSFDVVIEREILIDAAPAAVERALADESLFPRIYPRATLIRIDDQWPAPGSAMTVQYCLIGLTFDLNLSLLEHTPGSHVKSMTIHNAQFFPSVAGRISFEWSGEGAAIRVVCRYEYDVPNDRLTQELERWMMRAINTDNLEASLSNLKNLLETGRV